VTRRRWPRRLLQPRTPSVRRRGFCRRPRSAMSALTST